MPNGIPDDTAAGGIPRRLFFYNAGFLRQPRLRRVLALMGHDLRLGLPGPGDGVVVWGRSPYAARGEAVAARYGAPLVRIEDAFLRSVRPGRAGDAPMGLLVDPLGVHFDSAQPSMLEHILLTNPLTNSNLLSRAADGIMRIKSLDLSKYNLHATDSALPDPGYVLVIDQTRGDASIRYAAANDTTFARMLTAAKQNHPSARIVIKAHPETSLGLRPGHFSAADTGGTVSLFTGLASPWRLLDGAVAVYTVSSQFGFEAILMGHRPVVFGQPFYAGWGLSSDLAPVARRGRILSKDQLFAAAMLLAPVWYDPCRDRLCSFEVAVDQLEADVQTYRQDRAGHVALGMRLWKRGRLQQVFGREKPLIFRDTAAQAVTIARASGRGIVVWAGKEPADLPPDIAVLRVEDGFLRSKGLGANLVPPLSLIADDLGIYYDPNRESRLERLIQTPISPAARVRITALIHSLIDAGVSKYNLAGACPDLPPGLRILVPGQVENDASIRLGAADVRSNLDLLRAARRAQPAAVIVYKPHPDVEAGLRPGAVSPDDMTGLADVIATNADPVALIDACDGVVTITSLLGFEALLRGKPVTCLGMPFYAGWGLTHDFGPIPKRRLKTDDAPRPDLAQLAYATLIAYPRYYDPVSRRPCPPEVVIERLISGHDLHTGVGLRVLSKLQGRLATYARFWR